MLQGGTEQGFERQEGHYEFGRAGKALPIGFLAKRFDVGTYLTSVIRKVAVAFSLVLALDSFELGLKGVLRVDEHLTLIRQANSEVRTLVRFSEQGFLFGEVAVLEHASQFDHPTQLHFAPAAALDG